MNHILSIILVAALVAFVCIGQTKAILGLNSNAVTKLDKLLIGLTLANDLQSNIEAIKKRQDLIEKSEILKTFVELEAPPEEGSACQLYATRLLRFRQSLEREIKPNKLYSSRKFTEQSRLVRLFLDYNDRYYGICLPKLQELCQTSHDDKEDLQITKLYHYCPHSLLKLHESHGMPQYLSAFQCAARDYLDTMQHKNMEIRAVEFGDALAAMYYSETGKRMGLDQMKGNPKIVEELSNEYLLEPCKRFILASSKMQAKDNDDDDDGGSGLLLGVKLALAGAILPKQIEAFDQIPDGNICLGRRMRRFMMCRMILVSFNRSLINKIAGI